MRGMREDGDAGLRGSSLGGDALYGEWIGGFRYVQVAKIVDREDLLNQGEHHSGLPPTCGIFSKAMNTHVVSVRFNEKGLHVVGRGGRYHGRRL